MLKGPGSKKGFTFIEVLFVIVILGIMSAVVIPRLRLDFSTKQRVKSEVQKIVSNIRYTRKLAITEIDATSYIVRFYYGSNNYGIYRDNVNPANLVRDLIPIPPELNASGETEITFYRQGNCTFLSSGVIDISAAGGNFSITVQTATGRVRMNEN
jgi:prepilin-type N-terminal cleavage/methylation domain-containing protein